MSWEVLGAIVTVAIGAISYTVKKYFDWRVDKALTGQLDVLRKAHVERFDSVVRVKGMLAEIDHCIDHVAKGDTDYCQRCKDWCMKVRQDTRSMIALLGEDFVSSVKLTTDVALEYADKPSANLYERWKGQLERVYSAADTNVRVLQAAPKGNNPLAPPPH